MIFPGEHGIFGAKAENEFLEDKTRIRKMIKRQLYKKSYIKEIDVLMKDLKVRNGSILGNFTRKIN
jgi:hypothetical protein